MTPRHRVRYADCPLCGGTHYTRQGRKKLRHGIQTHLMKTHGLGVEYRLRSWLSDLAVEHTLYRRPRRTSPLILTDLRRNPPSPPRIPTEEEKRNGDTPRLRLYLESRQA